MADLDVTCSRCGATLQHECRPETLEEAALALFMWRPESGFPRALKRGNDDCDGSEDEETVPFLTESFLYPLLGKSDARSLMSRIHGVFEAMGVEPRAFEQKAWDWLEQKKRDKEEEGRAREAARRRYREEMSPVARVKQKSGFALCRYRSFYCFDVNVAECADGDCFEREDSKFKVKRKAPKLGAVVVKAGGMEISCALCKRVHSATPDQVAHWREEKRYPSRPAEEGGRGPTEPEDWIHAKVIFAALGFKRAS